MGNPVQYHILLAQGVEQAVPLTQLQAGEQEYLTQCCESVMFFPIPDPHLFHPGSLIRIKEF